MNGGVDPLTTSTLLDHDTILYSNGSSSNKKDSVISLQKPTPRSEKNFRSSLRWIVVAFLLILGLEAISYGGYTANPDNVVGGTIVLKPNRTDEKLEDINGDELDIEDEDSNQDDDGHHEVDRQRFFTGPPPQTKFWNGSNIWDLRAYSIWAENKICEVARNISSDPLFTPPTSNRGIVNLTFSCHELFTSGQLGSGNWITAFFAIRQVALASHRLEVVFHCPDAEEHKDDLIAPWLMGHFPLLEDLPASQQLNISLPTVPEACLDYKYLPLVQMFPFIRQEMRRMAVATVGVPSPDHPSAKFVEQYLAQGRQVMAGTMQLPIPETPTSPGVELDEVAIHFRCGDIISTNHPSFGFMKFKGFTDNIPADAKTIGILTQPFSGGHAQLRRADGGGKEAICKRIVLALVDYIQERFPDARVRIHNDVNETIVLAHARMIMARVTISPVSSFSVFPAVSSFGVGYIKRPEGMKAPNRFLLHLPPDDPDVQLFDAKYIPAINAKQFRANTGNDDFLIKWFQNDTHCNGWDGPTPILVPCN